MKSAPPERTTSVDQLLFDYTERLKRSPNDRCAVAIHISRLRPDNRGAHQMRIAANTFEALVKQFDGQIFVLQQGDIIFICREENAVSVDSAVTKVRFLFGDDPLAADNDDEESRFATWYNLGDGTGTFFAYVDELKREDEKRKKRASTITGGGAPVNERQPMDPLALNELINTIARADLTNHLRRQSISAITPGEGPKPLFRELYVSIADLRDAVMPRRDIASDRWLFQHLTQTLDKRVLALLRKVDDTALTHSFSLNLNIQTLLSPDFQAFDTNLKATSRGSIVIEIEKVDIFADLGAYLFARDFVRDRGYRLCLDGMTRLTLPYIDRAGLGLDLVKLFWTPDMADDSDGGDRQKDFFAALDRVGKGRLILARCDTEQAIAFGHKVGIKLFQGRIVEKMLAASGTTLTRNRLAAPTAAAR